MEDAISEANSSQAAQAALEKGLQEAQQSSESKSSGETKSSSEREKQKSQQAVSDLLQSTGLDRYTKNRANVSNWRAKLRKSLSKALGTTENFNSNAASARIEGELGRDEDIPVPRHIVLSIDCSGSMGPGTFKKALTEIDNFMVASRLLS